MSLKASVGKAEKKVEYGLQDGGHVYLRCSNCDALLMDIWRTRPYEKEVWTVRCNCPFCDEDPKTKELGGSYPVDIQGGFHPAGYGKLREGADEDVVGSTGIVGEEIDENAFVFVLKREGEPVYK